MGIMLSWPHIIHDWNATGVPGKLNLKYYNTYEWVKGGMVEQASCVKIIIFY